MFQLQLDKMVAALKKNDPVCFLPFFKQSLVEKRGQELFTTLDHGATFVLIFNSKLSLSLLFSFSSSFLFFLSHQWWRRYWTSLSSSAGYTPALLTYWATWQGRWGPGEAQLPTLPGRWPSTSSRRKTTWPQLGPWLLRGRTGQTSK